MIKDAVAIILFWKKLDSIVFKMINAYLENLISQREILLLFSAKQLDVIVLGTYCRPITRSKITFLCLPIQSIESSHCIAAVAVGSCLLLPQFSRLWVMAIESFQQNWYIASTRKLWLLLHHCILLALGALINPYDIWQLINSSHSDFSNTKCDFSGRFKTKVHLEVYFLITNNETE